jgi:streptomycin 3"-adenylyltransferase
MPARLIGPIPGSERADAQIDAVVSLCRAVLGADLIAIYLYGSATNGGLQHWSDLDLLVMTARSLDATEKRRLVDTFLRISSVWPEDPGARPGERMLEVTIVATPEVVPWRFPPRMELQYGEWLRKPLAEGGDLPADPEPNPDIALLIEQTRRDGRAAFGPPPRVGLPYVPPADVEAAILASVDELLRGVETDTANMFLTLARMWLTLSTGDFAPKDMAADWALWRIPKEDRQLVERARAIYLGEAADRWPESRGRLEQAAGRMAGQVRRTAEERRGTGGGGMSEAAGSP